MEDTRPLLENIGRLSEFISASSVYRSFAHNKWLTEAENRLAVRTLRTAVV